MSTRKEFAYSCAVLIGLFCVMILITMTGCASSATGAAPTTQQSLSQAQLVLIAEQVGLAAAETAVPKIKSASVRAAATAAVESAQSLLSQYQADINAGNLTALQLDQQNLTSAITQIAAAAGGEYIASLNASN